jgi:hypothetical protein
MMRLIVIFLLLIFSFLALDANAQSRLRPSDPPRNRESVFDPQIELELPLFSGNRCSANNSSVTLTPDKKALSILFSEFITQVGTEVGVLHARELCRVRIPIRIPRGVQVAIVKTDTRGFQSLPKGANSEISLTHHLSDQRSHRTIDRVPHRQVYNFAGPLEEDFVLGHHIESEYIWSACGTGVTLHLAIQSILRTESDLATTIIDTLDLQASEKTMDYHLLWRRCDPRIRQ